MREPRAAAATAVAVVVSVVGIVALTASSPAVLQQLMPAFDLSGAPPCRACAAAAAACCCGGGGRCSRRTRCSRCWTRGGCAQPLLSRARP